MHNGQAFGRPEKFRSLPRIKQISHTRHRPLPTASYSGETPTMSNFGRLQTGSFQTPRIENRPYHALAGLPFRLNPPYVQADMFHLHMNFDAIASSVKAGLVRKIADATGKTPTPPSSEHSASRAQRERFYLSLPASFAVFAIGLSR